VAVSVVLGVPGVYMAAEPAGLALGARLPASTLYLLDRDALTVGDGRPGRVRKVPGLQPVAAADFSGPLLAAVLSDGPATSRGGLELTPRRRAVFLGLTPVRDAAFGPSFRGAIALADGQYLRLRRSAGAWRARVRDAASTTLGNAAMPLRIADPAILGVDELADTGIRNRQYARRAACLLRGGGCG
jgi:hypothetical protein